MWWFDKHKYKLERAYELITYMILNYNDIVPADKYRKQGLEQARRVLQMFVNGNNLDAVIKDLRNRKLVK